MITVRTSGGLGNQMFQYAFGRAKALKNHEELRLFFSRDKSSTPRNLLLENFNIKSKVIGSVTIKDRLFKITERQYTFSEDMYDIPNGYFVGIWQSEKYFKDFAEEIRADFTLKNPLSVTAKAFEKTITENDSVSIHIRRGDYVSNPKTKEKHGLVPVGYYVKAILYIMERIPTKRFFIFSDDIEWVKDNLSSPPEAVFVSGNGLSECEELILMSLCKHHIIANSTFSWWAAWLNQNKDEVVIAPKQWFASGADESDLIPKNWIRM